MLINTAARRAIAKWSPKALQTFEGINKLMPRNTVWNDSSSRETLGPAVNWCGERRVGDIRHRQAASNHQDQEESTHTANQRFRQDY